MGMKKLGMSAREVEWDNRSKVYWGHRYDDKKPWTDPNAKLHDKQPSVQLRMTALAIDTGNDYLFGDEQRPTFAVDDDEQGTADLQDLLTLAGLPAHFSEMGRKGLLYGTVCPAFHKFEGGRWDSELVKLNAAEPTFGRDDRQRAIELGIDFDDLLQLDEYWRTYERAGFGPSTDREILHRRTWTHDQLIEYKPIPAEDVLHLVPDKDIPWQVDEDRTTPHELGFVPCEWIPNGMVDGDVDGRPIVDWPEYKIEDAVNYAISQAMRGVEYNGEPWLTFLNIARGSDDNAIRRGAGRTLSVEGTPGGAPADAKLLEMSGTGQEVALKLIMMLRQAFFEVARIVVHDPQKFAGTLSGVALQRLLQPTIMLVSGLRPLYGKRLGRLARKMIAAENGGRLADTPPVSVSWPEIVHMTDEERRQRVGAVGDAHDRGYLLFEDAVREVAPMFGVEDASDYPERLRREAGQGGTANELDPNDPAEGQGAEPATESPFAE